MDWKKQIGRQRQKLAQSELNFQRFNYKYLHILVLLVICFQFMSDKNRIIIFDTTMRDGEQSPGATMSLEEKIQIARCFDELGIDVIEAGFPIASPGDFEAVTEISKVLKKSIPAGLSRATKKDIDACKRLIKTRES